MSPENENPTEPTRSTEPNNAATQLADNMLERFQADTSNYADPRAIVMVTLVGAPGPGPNSGVALHGWPSDLEAIAYMFSVLKSVMRANGKDVAFATSGDDDPPFAVHHHARMWLQNGTVPHEVGGAAFGADVRTAKLFLTPDQAVSFLRENGLMHPEYPNSHDRAGYTILRVR